MIWPDYAIIATIAISMLVGLLRGFIKEVFSLVIWALAFVLAYQYGGDVAILMEAHVSLPSARAAMGFTGIFVAVLVLGGLLTYLIGRLVESTGLSGTDRFLGGFFGIARGLALVLAFLIVAGFTPIPADPWWKQSVLIERFQPLLSWAVDFLPKNIQEHIDFDPELSSDSEEKEGTADTEAQDGGAVDEAGLDESEDSLQI